ncbi:MAG: hypothetical protein ACRD24_02655 [Terriglobales bacterium]
MLPSRDLVLVSRLDGGNLVVLPPREAWERSELTPAELTQWSFLVAASGRAMLDVLPQLAGGCINYWEAGNWRLNEQAEPRGPKTGEEHRRVHMHLLGRSPTATDPSWRWGEAPKFPDFADRYTWAAKFERLSAEECRNIVARAEALLREHYGMPGEDIAAWSACTGCGYPTALQKGTTTQRCVECTSAR